VTMEQKKSEFQLKRQTLTTLERQKESEIQKDILDYLKAKGYTHWRSYVGPIVRGGHGGRRPQFSKNPMAGYPDVTGFLLNEPNQMFCMEIKTKKGIVSDEQIKWHKLLIEHGVIVMIPKSVEEAINTMELMEIDC